MRCSPIEANAGATVQPRGFFGDNGAEIVEVVIANSFSVHYHRDVCCGDLRPALGLAAPHRTSPLCNPLDLLTEAPAAPRRASLSEVVDDIRRVTVTDRSSPNDSRTYGPQDSHRIATVGAPTVVNAGRSLDTRQEPEIGNGDHQNEAAKVWSTRTASVTVDHTGPTGPLGVCRCARRASRRQLTNHVGETRYGELQEQSHLTRKRPHRKRWTNPHH